MQIGLTVSTLLHALLLAWALVSFAATQPMKLPEPEPVEVALITDEDLVRLTKGDRSSKNLQTAPAKKPEVEPTPKEAAKPTPRAAKPPAAAEPPPPEPDPPKAAETPPPAAADPIADKIAAIQKEPTPPPPGPAPEELKRIDDEKKAEAERQAAEEAKTRAEQKKAEDERKKKELADKKRKEDERKKKLAEKKRKDDERKKKLADAKKAEDDKKKQFDPGRLAALLNKIPDKPQPAAGSETPTTKPLPKGPQAGAPEGKDTQLSAGKRSMIGVMMKQAVRDCWRVQTGLEGAEKLVVDVEVRLKPDGSIEGQPRVVSDGAGALYSDASSRAISALVGCAPYASLPKDLYKGGWDHMVVTFDPQKMY